VLVRPLSLLPAVLAAGVVLTAAPAAAQVCDACSGGCAPVSGVAPGAATVDEPAAPQSGRQLPFTGADLAAALLAGSAAVGVGAAFVVVGRRRAVS
jgi:hypothetical protein